MTLQSSKECLILSLLHFQLFKAGASYLWVCVGYLHYCTSVSAVILVAVVV